MSRSARGDVMAFARRFVMVAAILVAGLGSVRAAQDPATTVAPEDDMKAADLSVVADRGELLIDGDLAEGTARRLRAMLRADASIRSIAFESDGGLVDEAEQIGDIVAARGLVTVVRKLCVSACTLAFVRGRERLAQEGAKLGFHAPWVPAEGGGEQQVPSEEERQAYVAAGIAADFVAEALAVPSTSIWFPATARLVEAKVVTAVLSSGDLSVRLAKLAPPSRLAAAAE